MITYHRKKAVDSLLALPSTVKDTDVCARSAFEQLAVFVWGEDGWKKASANARTWPKRLQVPPPRRRPAKPVTPPPNLHPQTELQFFLSPFTWSSIKKYPESGEQLSAALQRGLSLATGRDLWYLPSPCGIYFRLVVFTSDLWFDIYLTGAC